MASIKADNGGTTVPGTPAPDLIYSFNGNDTVYGGLGNDYINGGRGNDRLYGEDGDDVFEIGGFGSDIGLTPAGGLNNGWDNFYGGSGHDTISILPTSGFVWTAIQVNLIDSVEAIQNTSDGPGYVYFRGTTDFGSVIWLNGIDEFRGTSSADNFLGSELTEKVFGYAGNDTIFGRGGDDIIDGGAGADTLNGGDGVNILTGGAGADRFQFSTDFEQSTITDFSASQGDKIVLLGAIAGDFESLSIYDDFDGNTKVYAGTVEVTVQGVAADSLSASDFIFN